MRDASRGTSHPIFDWLDENERTRAWLARKANVSGELIRLIAIGQRNATASFRRRCVDALGLPESALFAPPYLLSGDSDRVAA